VVSLNRNVKFQVAEIEIPAVQIPSP